jgi:hypothetical protein
MLHERLGFPKEEKPTMEKDIPKPDLIMKKFEPISQSRVAEQLSGEISGPDSVHAIPGSSTAQENPDPKEQLGKSLGNLANRMRQNQTGWLAHFGFSYLDKRFGELRNACQELQAEFLALSDDAPALLQFRGKIGDLEASYNRLRFRLVQVPSFLAVAAASVIIGSAVLHSGIFDYVQDKLEIRRVMRFVLMAIAGALLWGLTSAMSRRESATPGDLQEATFFSVLVRILIAIIVSTIIVILTFKKDGVPLKLGQIWKSPEMWSFLAGYSCHIIILALNKVVEKVSKMIESL